MRKGRFFHTYKEGGVVHWQGVVLSTTKDHLEVQLFSWLDGHPTDILVLPKSETIWDDKKQTGWKFYADREAWLHAYQMYDARRPKNDDSAKPPLDLVRVLDMRSDYSPRLLGRMASSS